MSSSAGPSPQSFGHRLRRHESGGIACSEKLYRPHLVIPRHEHPGETVMMLAFSGRFLEIRGRVRDECGAHGFVLHPAGETHANVFGPEGAHCLVIEVDARRTEALRAPEFRRPLCVADERLASFGRRIVEELRISDQATPLAVEGLTLELMAAIVRRPGGARDARPPDWLRRVRDSVHDSSAQPFTLAGLAREAGVHPAHLARAFRRHFHCTAGEYVRRLRLDRAVERLSQSDEPLAAVAADAGFYDQSHFSRSVKARTGLPPAAYRAALRGRKRRTS